MKTVFLPDYKYIFDEKTGYFARWGKTMDDDPQMSPIGPEIADFEVSEICNMACKECYKSNTKSGRNTTFEEFKTVIDKMPSVLQVAFGIGDIDANPDFFKMMEYCRSKTIVPNVTINGSRLTDEVADKLAKLCGAVAVSNYGKNLCYNAVKKLTDRGMTQVNIHQLLSDETKDQAMGVIDDIKTDPRLAKLNAIVYLSLKKKGRGESYNRMKDEDFKALIDKSFEKDIRFGFDSCSSCKFTDAIASHPKFEEIIKHVEPCESTLFSSYINVNGEFFPCSFAEKGDGISVINSQDFLNDVWFNEKTIEWRNNLLANKRSCPLFEV